MGGDGLEARIITFSRASVHMRECGLRLRAVELARLPELHVSPTLQSEICAKDGAPSDTDQTIHVTADHRRLVSSYSET